MPICGIVGCSNRPGEYRSLSSFKIPKVINRQGDETRILSEERRRVWKAAMNRVDIQTEDKWDRTLVCSKHFVGGGTVDFTAILVSETRGFDVIHEASGGPWGGRNINKGLKTIFKNIFTRAVYKRFKKKYPEDYRDLCQAFEVKKRNLREDREFMTITIPVTLVDLYNNMTKKSFFAFFKEKKEKLLVENGKMKLKYSQIEDLFEDPCKNILDHTKAILKHSNCKDINTLLLIGGFSNSNILKRKMEKAFPVIKIFVPHSPELAVLKGAVMFGNRPGLVKTRIAKYTYGTNVASTFEEGKHPRSKMQIYDGIKRCTDIFNVHVKKGQTLYAGKAEPGHRYNPSLAKQTKLLFEIYASTDDDPEFVTDASCMCIGNLTLDIPDTSGGRDRVVYAQMSFGETEMKVEATEEKTGKTILAKFQFRG